MLIYPVWQTTPSGPLVVHPTIHLLFMNITSPISLCNVFHWRIRGSHSLLDHLKSQVCNITGGKRPPVITNCRNEIHMDGIVRRDTQEWQSGGTLRDGGREGHAGMAVRRDTQGLQSGGIHMQGWQSGGTHRDGSQEGPTGMAVRRDTFSLNLITWCQSQPTWSKSGQYDRSLRGNLYPPYTIEKKHFELCGEMSGFSFNACDKVSRETSLKPQVGFFLFFILFGFGRHLPGAAWQPTALTLSILSLGCKYFFWWKKNKPSMCSLEQKIYKVLVKHSIGAGKIRQLGCVGCSSWAVCLQAAVTTSTFLAVQYYLFYIILSHPRSTAQLTCLQAAHICTCVVHTCTCIALLNCDLQAWSEKLHVDVLLGLVH